MSRAQIKAGICGFETEVTVTTEGDGCRIQIHSACPDIQKLGEAISHVDPMQEAFYLGEGGPSILRAASLCCPHPACPVPVGILKAVELEAGLALPADVAITLER